MWALVYCTRAQTLRPRCNARTVWALGHHVCEHTQHSIRSRDSLQAGPRLQSQGRHGAVASRAARDAAAQLPRCASLSWYTCEHECMSARSSALVVQYGRLGRPPCAMVLAQAWLRCQPSKCCRRTEFVSARPEICLMLPNLHSLICPSPTTSMQSDVTDYEHAHVNALDRSACFRLDLRTGNSQSSYVTHEFELCVVFFQCTIRRCYKTTQGLMLSSAPLFESQLAHSVQCRPLISMTGLWPTFALGVQSWGRRCGAQAYSITLCCRGACRTLEAPIIISLNLTWRR